jgi:hypothetical protein
MSYQANSCGCAGGTNCTCGCCEGIRAITPVSVANPPGLSALVYRAGTHATFLETMIADLTASGDAQLAKLGTRDPSDPAIAFLDGWATVADILTFYQERIANEGYLRTAIQRRSILELARLIGYRVRPGVSASVHLAYTIDSAFEGDAIIPAGTRATSVPGPGELQQTFETSEDLVARASWNLLQPRLTRPQTFDSILRPPAGGPRLYVQGVSTNLKANDPILLENGDQVFRVYSVEPDTPADRTLVRLVDWVKPTPPGQPPPPVEVSVDDLAGSSVLFKPRSVPPANARQLPRSLASISANSDASFKVFDAFMPETAGKLVQAVQNATVTPATPVQAYAFRVKAGLFANNLPGIATTTITHQFATETGQTSSDVVTTAYTDPTYETTVGALNPSRNIRLLALDAEYSTIKPGDFLFIDYASPTESTPSKRSVIVSKVASLETRTLTFGGASAKVTLVGISPGLPETLRSVAPFIRGTVVYAQSELLPLAEEVIDTPICGGDEEIELDGLYSDLEAGRWLLITGERSDVSGTTGVPASEVLMLSEVRHDVAQAGANGTAAAGGEGPAALPGDKMHTFIRIASQLAYCYKRDTVKLYGNVAHATHGETRRESLGNGDATQTFQQAVLKQSPLTYISAPTASGIESTLQVFVNDVQWHEADSAAALGPNDRGIVTKTDDEAKTTVIFGDGVHGARTPTGRENLRTVYRSGIGQAGNVKAGQISQLGDRPLGVTGVGNLLPSSGGADAESRDQARRNAPLAVTALDRLVSVQDYADFSRTFAGVSKASSAELPGAHGSVVHVTIAGVDDIPIAEDSDLLRNLGIALVRYGDPIQAVRLAVRDRVLLVLSAGVKILSDYVWEKVEPNLRAAVLDAFGFDRRDLGQDAFLSEVIAALQAVEGVQYVDVDSFGGVPGLKPDGTRLAPSEIAARIAEIGAAKPASRVQAQLARPSANGILPAQVAYFAPDLPATLVLNEVKA